VSRLKSPEDHVIVVFGATGDLARRKLLPALYHLAEATRLACWYLWPFIPTAAAEGHRRLCAQAPFAGLGAWGVLQPGARVESGPPLFPRV